ncbi:(Fe-S)-binding protein [Solemya velesiana gill symbiont]|uniref:Oxidoreductase n=1 Tax=Solemya velesiana gill symbiont TaxID=1918948 RepID=A0A1T2KSB6_9GAMM|nr:(Fe-S)-binding protein [Solemya velesiana gill symbiont]OOZ35755.1 oxidoreductase [Solemya velesiana gill symbiont]
MERQRHYPEKPGRIYFFGTCLVDLLYPEASLAGMQLIQREGVDVIFPKDQTCCGQPAWNSGYRDEARAVALAQLKCFPLDYPVVVPSGSCAGMMRHHYPRLFKNTPQEQQVQALANRVYKLTEFLVHVLKITLKDLGTPAKVALHTSCSARREMGVAEEHEALLQQLGNVELVEQERKAECCGFGGTFAVKHPKISAEMVSEKAEHISNTSADTLVSGDCGCLMNISGRLNHQAEKIKGKHIASFLWERTNADSQ